MTEPEWGTTQSGEHGAPFELNETVKLNGEYGLCSVKQEITKINDETLARPIDAAAAYRARSTVNSPKLSTPTAFLVRH
ncbi:hypothetical protein [uncultured Gulosibacter sp.]|uniref:hypothetical protein n=1 Tax=uncultured Gulosibacter sp. TaxID=1339167 RepID=UPI002888FEC9|nr:hypothetical protein [uncultured Gulosibacter sp.]